MVLPILSQPGTGKTMAVMGGGEGNGMGQDVPLSTEDKAQGRYLHAPGTSKESLHSVSGV